jgi:protein kinase X
MEVSAGLDDEHWTKTGPFSTIDLERRIYEALGPHPHVVPYRKVNKFGELILQRLSKGTIYTHLLENDPPFRTRIRWAAQIAYALARVHQCDVVWNDCHFENVLITDHGDAAICDFGAAYIKPNTMTTFVIGPPLPFLCPWPSYGQTAMRNDIFAFGVMLFALLSKRFPHHHDLSPDLDGCISINEHHERRNFDTLSTSKYPLFSDIIQKCFKLEYYVAGEVIPELEKACSEWVESFEKVCGLFNLSACQLTFKQGDVEDPDLSLPTY